VTRPDFNPEAFLVDLDGVLVSSYSAHLEAYEESFRDHDLSFSPELRCLVRGGASRAEVLARAAVAEHLRASLSRAKGEAFEAAVRRGKLAPSPGALRFLECLSDRGCPVGVVSNSAAARACLEALAMASLISVVVDAPAVQRPKPDPEGFLRAAEALGVSPTLCVAVEDSRPGAEAARAAGTFVVGVGTRLDLERVDFIVADLDGIPVEAWLSRCPAVDE
jgi:HAD superfamily hydrolase (TIGR01509 family)